MARQTKANHPPKPQRRPPTDAQTRVADVSTSFDQTYPAIAEWVESWGWIEMGQDDFSRSMVRALDIGGMVWEGKSKYSSLDELLHDLETALTKWFKKNR